MPLQFNQTKRALSWTIGGKSFQCDAFDSVDVPIDLIEPSQKRGIPISATPVAPEVRAARKVEEEKVKASNDAWKALQRRVGEAEASVKLSTEHAEQHQRKVEDLVAQVREKDSVIAGLEQRLRTSDNEKKAVEELLKETARSATEAEERAQRAGAVMREQSSARSQKKSVKKAG